MQIDEYLFWSLKLNENGEAELALLVLEKGLQHFPESKELWAYKSAVAGSYNYSYIQKQATAEAATLFNDKNELFSIEYDKALSISKKSAYEYISSSIKAGEVVHEVIFSKIKSIMEKCFPDVKEILEIIPALNILDYYFAMLQLYGHLENREKELALLEGLVAFFNKTSVNHEVSQAIRSRHKAVLQKISSSLSDENTQPLIKKRPRVALCISGQFRVGLDELKQNIGYFTESCDCDIFIASWGKSHDIIPSDIFSPTWRPKVFARSLPNIFSGRVLTLSSKYFFKKFPSLIQFAQNYTEPEEISIDEIREELNPQGVTISNEERFTNSIIARHNPASVDELNQYKMFFNIKTCNDLKRRYEKKHGFKYDLVVRMRPDSIFSGKFDPESYPISPENFYVNYLNVGRMADALGIGCSETMDHYAQIWSIISKGVGQVKIPGFRRKLHPHTTIFDHMWLSGYNLVFKSMPPAPLKLPEEFKAEEIFPGVVQDISKRLEISEDDLLDLKAIVADLKNELSGNNARLSLLLETAAAETQNSDLKKQLNAFIHTEDKQINITNQHRINSHTTYNNIELSDITKYLQNYSTNSHNNISDVLPLIQFWTDQNKDEAREITLKLISICKSKGRFETASNLLHYVSSNL
ncbi:hypothetical protein [Desulfovibrio gilichinskyi]|uniref:DUF7796 domain-containing protein n=1 Tax=Desulfovibrio gilichinskyi TaxID=1519643 RepID=A0A1X7CYT1_9BACT|nr:hypothetical protein [Desulfovibrio gilichinskyi]SMF05579.1 hypothetical protein SAMN06295933_1444 [Desulfovibrio gilichinskyi]